MRVSTHKNHPGFRPDANLFRVYLDGLEQDYCHTADEEKGEIVCYITVDGIMILDKKKKRIREMTLTGNVSLIVPTHLINNG